jgi:hypothetical protein
MGIALNTIRKIPLPILLSVNCQNASSDNKSGDNKFNISVKLAGLF